MIKDRTAFDLPAYDGLLTGHYRRGPGYGRKRPGGTDDWLLILTLAGQGRFSGQRGDLLANPDCLTLIAPGTTHDYGIAREVEEWELLWVHFHPRQDWLALLDWPEQMPGLRQLRPADIEQVTAAFHEVNRLALESGPHSKAFAMNALERLLLLCASSLPSEAPKVDDRVLSALRFVHANLNSDLSSGDLATRAGISESRFAHLFRDQVGLPPRQYLLQQRMIRGRSLLERTSMTVAEIAHAVGMDPVAFSLRFRAEFGESPSQHRRSARSSSSSPADQQQP